MKLGIDLGGTKIAAIVLDDGGAVRWETRMPTPRDDYERTIRAVVGIVADGERAAGEPCTVGIGIPGAVSPATHLVKGANSTWLIGRPLAQDLERALDRPVRLENDANCLAMSEAADGAAAGARIVFSVILGTGTGGGLAVGGEVLTGANAIAGEWGHNPLPWPDAGELPGPPCYCGKHGCIETFLSGPGIAGDYRRRGGDAVASEVVAARAAAGEPRAHESMQAWASRLARGLASIINIVDPDVIVVGGGLSRISSMYADVPREWRRWVFSDECRTRLVPAAHGDASGVRGAARLWPTDMLPSL